MSDTRFTMLGIALIFVGFIVLGVFGSQFDDTALQAEEFGDCFEYFEDAPPEQVECDVKLQERFAFGALIAGLLGAGIVFLIKGVKGKWDQDTKPEDMLGPA